jgi:hypothetical protein
LDEKERIPVAVTCRAQGLSKQASSAWKNNPLSQRIWPVFASKADDDLAKARVTV